MESIRLRPPKADYDATRKVKRTSKEAAEGGEKDK
jgi:hypothetical protein